MIIKKAIIPVVGMGTWFLPAAKAVPKELLPIIDKPVIQHIVEEAVASGIKEITFVISKEKEAIKEHFTQNTKLENVLKKKKKQAELDAIKHIHKLAKFSFVEQNEPRGDGHAILCALPITGTNEPIAVLFGDELIDAKTPALQQLISVYHQTNAPVIGVAKVAKKDVSKYGVISGKKASETIWNVKTVVEKPSVQEAPSNLIIISRYILTPELLKILPKTTSGKDGETRLADALRDFAEAQNPLYAHLIEGNRYDCGSKIGYTKAQIELGLKHPEIGKDLKRFLTNKRS